MCSPNKLAVIILLLLGNFFSAADFLPIHSDSILVKIRNHEFEEVEYLTKSILSENKSSPAEKQLVEELQYYNAISREYGFYKKFPLRKRNYNKPLSNEIKAVQLLNQGYYGLLYEVEDESGSFIKLKNALKIAQSITNKPLTCEISKAIFTYYIRLFNIYDQEFLNYNEVYKANIYDETESNIRKLMVFFLKIKNDEKSISNQEVQEIENISRISSPKYCQVYAKKSLAIYYEVYKKNYPKASAYYLAALGGDQKYGADIFFHYTVLSCYSLCLVTWEKYREAIHYLNLQDSTYIGKTAIDNFTYKYSTLSNAYAGLKIYDSAFIYKDKSRILKNKFEQSKHNAIINELNVKEKDQKINSQSKLLMNYEQNKWLYFALITVVFIIAMYSFVRWKKVDLRRKKLAQEKDSLQVEHYQTIEKLKKVNQLVVQDNIILKNKAKIYLNELQYIKADDHYLNIFTKDGKNHFVRGRLADIIEELPPNFIKCHRSYIVNKNFIKNAQSKFLVMMDNSEVPISRGFKL